MKRWEEIRSVYDRWNSYAPGESRLACQECGSDLPPVHGGQLIDARGTFEIRNCRVCRRTDYRAVVEGWGE